MNKVLITSRHHMVLEDILRQAGYDIISEPEFSMEHVDLDQREIAGIVTSNSFAITARVIDAFPNLKFIGRLGSGMEIIDVSYAESKGITCVASPAGNANAVAEHALGMLLSLINNIRKSQRELESGMFLRAENMGRELYDLKVGIIGYGHNGKQFADYLSMMGAELYIHDVVPKTIPGTGRIHFSLNMDDILEYCDCLSFHIPIGTATRYYIDTIIPKMKNDFILINCARGELLSIEALYKGLLSGKIAGACIDVWEQEPVSKLSGHKLSMFREIVERENVIASPHIAGYTHQAFYKMSRIVAEKIAAMNFLL